MSTKTPVWGDISDAERKSWEETPPDPFFARADAGRALGGASVTPHSQPDDVLGLGGSRDEEARRVTAAKSVFVCLVKGRTVTPARIRYASPTEALRNDLRARVKQGRLERIRRLVVAKDQVAERAEAVEDAARALREAKIAEPAWPRDAESRARVGVFSQAWAEAKEALTETKSAEQDIIRILDAPLRQRVVDARAELHRAEAAVASAQRDLSERGVKVKGLEEGIERYREAARRGAPDYAKNAKNYDYLGAGKMYRKTADWLATRLANIPAIVVMKKALKNAEADLTAAVDAEAEAWAQVRAL